MIASAFDGSDMLGHVGYFFLVFGTVLLGHRHASGWLVRLAGSLVFIALGFLMGMSSMVVWSIAFAVIEVRGFVHWKRTHDYHDVQAAPGSDCQGSE